MKHLLIIALSLLLLNSVIFSSDLFGQSTSTMHKANPNPFPKPTPTPEPPLSNQRPKPQATVPQPVKDIGVTFTLPGIIGLRDKRWVGSDNLYNLKPNISVYVEIVAPEDQKFSVNEQDIKERVQQILSKAGIQPIAFAEPGEPPFLPLYHVLIMLNEVDPCIMACCACRLFESVTLKRVILDPGITYQAITWEKQDLISASKKDFYPLVEKTIDELTASFVERFQYFVNLKR